MSHRHAPRPTDILSYQVTLVCVKVTKKQLNKNKQQKHYTEPNSRRKGLSWLTALEITRPWSLGLMSVMAGSRKQSRDGYVRKQKECRVIVSVAYLFSAYMWVCACT